MTVNIPSTTSVVTSITNSDPPFKAGHTNEDPSTLRVGVIIPVTDSPVQVKHAVSVVVPEQPATLLVVPPSPRAPHHGVFSNDSIITRPVIKEGEQLTNWCVPQQWMKLPWSSRGWWWGVMLLSMCLFALRLWLVEMSGTTPRTLDGFETKLRGQWGQAAAYAVVTGILHVSGFLVVSLLLRVACRNPAAAAAAADGGADLSLVPAENTRAWYAGVALGGLDRQTLEVAAKWCGVFVVTVTVGGGVMGAEGVNLAFACSYVFGAFYLLPRAAIRWLAEERGRGEGGGGAVQQGPSHRDDEQRGRKLTSLVVRTILVGMPLFWIQAYLSYLLSVMSAQQLSFIYPYALSVVEYLMVSKLLNDRVVEGHNDEALSVVGRWFIAIMESGRVGLLVVTYTAGGGTLQGFVFATLNSALSEVLGRTGVYAMTRQALKEQYKHGWRGSWCGGSPRPRFRLLPLNSLGRFKRVYWGCKTDTEFWPVSMLAILTTLDYGKNFGAHDPVTGELLPALHCGVDVFAVVVGGEILTEACVFVVEWAVALWCPKYSLHIVSVRPRGSLVVTLLVWSVVGMFTLNGITGSGSLVEELQKTGGGGGG